ncbi:hypothetical protein [Robiginitalea sp.]|uniref:hypothetical protein n=1 Tax=Robiginitalea sp. TaxID=1902411 RepID=UPI003C5972C8
MGILSKLISYFIHPLLVPTIGTVFYFMVTPKYSPSELILGNLIPIFILTALIPLGSLLILNQFGMTRSRLLLTSEERIYPLLIFLALLLLILLRVIPNNFTVELYYFFMGIALSVTSCLLLALMGKVVSLHMVGIGTLLMFVTMLSFHFEKNIVVAISLCTLCSGLLASARLYLNRHGRAAVLTGWLIGLVSQLILIRFWL